MFEGDSVDYYRDVLSGKIPSTEPERARAADRLFEVDLKIREQKLAAEAELIQAARVKACLDEGTILVRRKKMGKDSTHSMDRDELRDLRKLQRATNSPYVFTTERGGPLSVRALQYIVAEAGEEAGLPEHLSHPHALRHAAGYSLINNDVDVRLVQEFLGHKTPAKRLAALRVR